MLQENKTVWDLELHESIRLADHMICTKVPGGWLYLLNSQVCFVPDADQELPY